MEIRECSPDEVFDAPGYQECFDEYSAECGDDLIGERGPACEIYRTLHQAGGLICGAVMDEGKLVGVVFVVVNPAPHYRGKVLANVESLFLRKSYRTGARGMRLIRWARDRARERGCASMAITTTAGSGLEKLGFRAWRHTNTIFRVEL